jgi:hypothetical protein
VEARAVGLRCLGSTTLKLAQKAVEIALTSTSELSLKESVQDLRDVRGDPTFNQAIDTDLAASEDAVGELLIEALQAGLESELSHQKTRVRGLVYQITPAEEEMMAGYPIQGHTPSEMSASMHAKLRYEVNGTMASPLIGDSEAASMPQLLGGVVQRFADSCANAAEEAYYAGTQLAIRMVAKAIREARHAH